MTDNEKAATFIGWRPEECKDCEESYMGAHVEYRSAKPYHCVPAPDMTKPENYMRANVNWLIFTTAKEPFTAWSKDSCFRGEGRSAVEALAALYDKENANG